MIFNLEALPDQSSFYCDLCIVGGGAAGITIALEFANSGVEVLLLESGDLELDDATQELYRGEDIGLPYFDLEYSRLRYFGGTTNHWGGMCRPLDPIDFETRDWVAHSGWPISYDEFSAYLPRANTICEIPDSSYDADYWMIAQAKSLGRSYEQNKSDFAVFDDTFHPGILQFSPPTKFGETYRQKLEAADNIKILLNANVTNLDTPTNPNKVDKLQVMTITKKQATVHPKQVVLATGGIENARILLASNKTHARGLGNKHDLVGRFFADHIELESGYILTNSNTKFFDQFKELLRPARFSMDVKPEVQRQNKLVNICMTIERAHNQSITADGVSAARKLSKQISRGKWPDNFLSDVGTAILGMDDIISYTWSKNKPKKSGLYLIMNRVEPQPNPDSRVILSDELDALGMPQVKLNWQLSELDYHSIYQMQNMFAHHLGQSGYGRMNIELDQIFNSWPDFTHGGNHHMGTTRMVDNEKKGVVDKNCKVFNIENLYIAGSSIFPTYGHANPTLNLVALAVRLADHLKIKMGSRA